MIRNLFTRSTLATALILVCSAHIGSPDAWFSGTAGPYPIEVQVTAPNVVPGIAKISIVVRGDGVQQVTAAVNKFDAMAASPPPDVAVRDEKNPEIYRTELWVMSGGSNGVTVKVNGSKGSGTAVIPVVVVATKVLQMDKPMGFGLAAVGIFLLVGAITIVASAARESVLNPGEQPDARRQRIAKLAGGVATVFLSAILFGGWTWWNSEENNYKGGLFKPLTAIASANPTASGLKVSISIAESSWIKRRDSAWLGRNGRSTYSPLIPDHGKLMHMFLVGGPGNVAFAHLHPVTTDSVTFTSSVSGLPAGKYRAFGDIVHESGFSQTLSSTVVIPGAGAQVIKVTDPDDAVLVHEAGVGTEFPLEDGFKLMWETATAERTVGAEAGLRFKVIGPDGKAAILDQYMGMAGHAVVMREDGLVFVHLHPGGTISMASQMALEMRRPGDSLSGTLSKRMSGMTMENQPATFSGEAIAFPYAFPQAGNYTVWVQVKLAGQIQTAAFRVIVKP